MTDSESLLNAGQRALEQQAVVILATPAVRAACDEVESLWANHPLRRTEQERSQIRPAVEELAMASALDTIGDPGEPTLLWSLAPAHHSGDLAVPASRYGVDNPDNVYRFARIDGRCTYRLRGRFPGAPPNDFSVTALPFSFGDGAMGATVGFVGMADLQTGADGSFEILITPEGGPGCVAGLNAVQLCVRQTIAQWSAAAPAILSLERISGPAPARRPEDELAQEAARLLLARGRFLPDGLQRAIYQRCPVNQVIPPAKAGPLGGLVTQVTALGHFDLAEDEALVLSADPLGAAYLGFQIADPWMVSYPYVEHFGSLNAAQAEIGPDGRMSLVLARQDPGFINWIEPYGGHSGSITFRWQRFPADAEFGPDTVRVEKMPVGDVAAALAGKGAFITVEQRAEQRAARRSAWSRRLGAG